MSLHAVNHFSYSVSDLDRSIDFWTKLLESEPYFHELYADIPYIGDLVGYEGAIQHAAFFRLPGQPDAFLELIQYLHPQPERVAMQVYNVGISHLCFATDDLEATRQLVESIGGTVKSKRMTTSDYGVFTGTKSLFFTDPDGISVQLVELPEGVDPAGRG
jgi:catechol 2,3-dioxygenase-like lactoylglutathione lyase family enzyme